ncbi:hypothetical protein HAX54_039615, partial [Datura stramonium]|nr:hypothetical protein [Datura stramonium]
YIRDSRRSAVMVLTGAGVNGGNEKDEDRSCLGGRTWRGEKEIGGFCSTTRAMRGSLAREEKNDEEEEGKDTRKEDEAVVEGHCGVRAGSGELGGETGLFLLGMEMQLSCGRLVSWRKKEEAPVKDDGVVEIEEEDNWVCGEDEFSGMRSFR